MSHSKLPVAFTSPILAFEYGVVQSILWRCNRGKHLLTCSPKTAIVYASVFAAFIPEKSTLNFNAIVLSLIFLIEMSWHTIVAITLSTERLQAAYLKYKKWIDRSAESVIGILSLDLAISAG